MTRFAGNKM